MAIPGKFVPTPNGHFGYMLERAEKPTRKAARPLKAMGGRQIGRKRKKASYASLKKALDSVFSEWTRRSYADGDGMVQCITCGRMEPWKRMQCGHFVSRVHLATRWDERNCGPQDYACNVLRRGSPAEFSLWLTTKYGPNILKELVDLKHSTVKFSRSDLLSKIEEFRERLQALG